MNRALLLLTAAIPLSMLPALPTSAQAQQAPADAQAQSTPATLVADQVFITRDRKLIAEGNVEAFQGDVRLKAQRIVFDRTQGSLQIEGPIRIDQRGDVTILADAAQLDPGLQNGLLTGARMVFQQQLQLAALQMTRVQGRYSQLFKTAVTSCDVCDDGRPPLWQIRARKITHDEQERQLYFEEAQFMVMDVPVFYVPAMRLPDPTLERATGFLIPSIRTTSQLSTGIKVPYFFRLGDHADLTLSPYLSPKTRTLDFRYRQAFRTGRITFEGAYTRDDLEPSNDRGYFYAFGQFDVGRDFQLEFNLKTVSDNAYLSDYGLEDPDRLRSEIALSRYRRDEAIRLAVIDYNSLRDGVDESILPTTVFDAEYERRLFPSAIGGELRLAAFLHAHHRTSAADVTGRDVGRATVDVSWQRSWIATNGLRTDWEIGTAIDTFGIYDDSGFPSRINRTTPRAALTFSLPMTRRGPGGGTHFLEPVAQLGWSDVSSTPVPNDESRFVEFDQGSLLDLSRFPANDVRKDGLTFVYGLNWAHYAAQGWQANATIGQVFRENSNANFSTTSGLAGTSSNLLLAGQLKLTKGLAITARGLMDGSLDLSKAELRGDWISEKASLSSTYLWLGIDPAEGRTAEVSELWFDGSYQVSANWTASANLRYDFADSRARRAGVGLVYNNECVTVDLSLNRRYTSTTSVEPSTDFGFTISLNGFAVDSGTEEYKRSCRHT
jgi:LPS-assembly protein